MNEEKGQSPSKKITFQRSNGHLGISLPPPPSLHPINIVENNQSQKFIVSLFFPNLQKEGLFKPKIESCYG